MKNFKINMNRPPLNDSDLSPKGDFNQLLKNYKALKAPFYKTAKFWIGSSATLVATIAAVLVYTNVIDTASDDFKFKSDSCINPPVDNADIKPDTYLVNAESDSTVVHSSGSQIHIPANAFLDENGNPVKGLVEVKYREFTNPADIFLAGIPMTYDSAGEQYHFESAGMMEIAASQNGIALQTNPAAIITVDMVSNNPEDKFNTYYLDTATKKWEYLEQVNYTGKKVESPVVAGDSSTVPFDTKAVYAVTPDDPEVAVKEQLVFANRNEILQLEKQKPIEPRKLDKNKHRFSISVDEKEFPEMASYNNLKFQVEDKSYDALKAKVLWENVEMQRIEGSVNYQITFSNTKEEYVVIASPVFDDKDFNEARKIYETKFADYQAKLTQKKADEAKLKADLEARAKEMEARIQKEIEEQVQRRKEYEGRLEQNNLVLRTFQVQRFGFWNCDQPCNLPKGANVVAKLVDAKTNEPLRIQTCYLVEKGRNAIFTYYVDGLANFRYDPGKENIVWAVMSDLKVAILKPAEFKSMQVKHGEMKLELTVLDRKFESSVEVKEYLGI
jgi:hypothetical protein